MKVFKLLVLAIGIGIIGLCSTQTFGQVNDPQEPEKRVFLREMLREMGDKYDCYFTLELGVDSGKRSLEEDQSFASGVRSISLKYELEMLSKTILNFTYSFDSQKPQIIHIVDDRLAQGKRHPLDEIIGVLEFDGALRELISEIGNQGVAISSLGGTDTREMRVLDYGTQVHVKETKKPVRDILTNSVPLKDRGRLLWIAETKLGTDDKTFVRFLR